VPLALPVLCFMRPHDSGNHWQSQWHTFSTGGYKNINESDGLCVHDSHAGSVVVIEAKGKPENENKEANIDIGSVSFSVLHTGQVQ
jgi:hypothetical protein